MERPNRHVAKGSKDSVGPSCTGIVRCDAPKRYGSASRVDRPEASFLGKVLRKIAVLQPGINDLLDWGAPLDLQPMAQFLFERGVPLGRHGDPFHSRTPYFKGLPSALVVGLWIGDLTRGAIAIELIADVPSAGKAI
jgi:hypothetical protein